MCQFDEFWKRKIRTHFRRLDTNHDGFLTRQDFGDMAERYGQLGTPTADQCRDMRTAFLTYWDVILGDYTKIGAITAEVYIEALIKQGEVKILHYVNCIESLLFDLMDPGQSGFIDDNDFVHWFKVVGLDEKLAAKTFNDVGLKQGQKMSRDEYMTAVKEFFVGEDQTSPFRFFWGPLDPPESECKRAGFCSFV